MNAFDVINKKAFMEERLSLFQTLFLILFKLVVLCFLLP